MKDTMSGDALIRRAEQLFSGTERKNAENQWDLISEFVLPNMSGVFNGRDTLGGKKTNRLYDSTAIQANQDLASSINSTVTNPASQWSKIRHLDEKLNNNPQVVAWLEKANDAVHLALNESNFYTEINKAYRQYTALGNMAIFEEAEFSDDGEFDGLRFRSIHLANISWSENAKGEVDTIFRKMHVSARQAAERWGEEKLPKHIAKCLHENPDKEFIIYHAIVPRPNAQIKVTDTGLAAPKNRPFASIYIEQQSREILEESGYYEFPVFALRWDQLPGEVYGRGPGHVALPDIRTMNTLKEHSLKALAKSVNPPLIGVHRNILGSLDMRPGSFTVVKDINGIRELPFNPRFDITQFSADQLQESIKAGFFLDKLMLPPRTQTGEMTAFEVAQRAEQMQKVLGPTMGRLHNELLQPLLIRTFKILLRAGALPQVPDALRQSGIDVEIIFVNQLARAQKVEDLGNITQWAQELAALAQVKPEVLDYINADGIAKHTAKIRGVPEIVVTNEEEVQEIRAQRAQQQQQAQALQAGVQIADIQSKTE